MTKQNIYEQNGCKDRADYLKSIADEYGTDITVASSLAEILGENEDFDGLISAMEDIPMI
jgi:hypothetical protein